MPQGAADHNLRTAGLKYGIPKEKKIRNKYLICIITIFVYHPHTPAETGSITPTARVLVLFRINRHVSFVFVSCPRIYYTVHTRWKSVLYIMWCERKSEWFARKFVFRTLVGVQRVPPPKPANACGRTQIFVDEPRFIDNTTITDRIITFRGGKWTTNYYYYYLVYSTGSSTVHAITRRIGIVWSFDIPRTCRQVGVISIGLPRIYYNIYYDILLLRRYSKLSDFDKRCNSPLYVSYLLFCDIIIIFCSKQSGKNIY